MNRDIKKMKIYRMNKKPKSERICLAFDERNSEPIIY